MLCLSRTKGEKVYVGNDIVITVVSVDRGKIVLGIDAPKDVPIRRDDMKPAAGAVSGDCGRHPHATPAA